ncbi:MAG TPA: tRNA pseudouridine(38-40) synthase TruA [Victivallales bacterium]|nr:tRNA pseudouridine(38-40) synthase TruA [Victivallales bacterium]
MSSKNYLMEVAYDGTEYSGWQIQPNHITVQSKIEEKLKQLYKTKINITGAGRTDAGVHALGMTASFAVPEKPVIPPEALNRALNDLLPNSISINKIYPVNNEFNARFDAKGKAYTYVISTKRDINPFSYRWSWKLNYSFDICAIQNAANLLIGEHDFTAFGSELAKNGKNPIREIYKIDIYRFDSYICITFLGRSFLYKMVRSLVGALVQVGIGKLKSEDIRNILISKDRMNLFKTAPANGLFLMKVFYDKNEWKLFKLDQLPFYK